jgi:hypothetical protein
MQKTLTKILLCTSLGLSLPILGSQIPQDRGTGIRYSTFGKQVPLLLPKNAEKFDALRKFNLPIGEYAIVSSGALGIRNIREIGDIDLIVTPALWDTLAAQYGVTDKDGVKKIVLADGLIEAFTDWSFAGKSIDANAPTIAERIERAEMIDGLPFERLEYVLFFKRKMGREKDLKDIVLIEDYLKKINTL